MENRGITLVALVITIIILLLLAGITISLTIQGGILEQAKTAKTETQKQQALEELSIKTLDLQSEKLGKATLQNMVEKLEKDTENRYQISLQQGHFTEGEKIIVGDANKIYVMYKGYEFEIDTQLKVTIVGEKADVEEIGSKGFEYTGNVQEYILKKNKVYKIECWAAQGGYLTTSTSGKGGLGGYTSGEITVKEDTKIYIYVGNSSMTYNVASWNNGSMGYLSSDSNGIQYGFAGGGATDVRIIPTPSSTNYDNIASLTSRIMVAGAGRRKWRLGEIF